MKLRRKFGLSVLLISIILLIVVEILRRIFVIAPVICIVIFALTLSLSIMVVFIRFVIKPLKDLNDSILSLTVKDVMHLDRALYIHKSNDEFGELSDNLNRLMVIFREITGQIKKVSERLIFSIQRLPHSAQQISASTEDISLLIQEISKKAITQKVEGTSKIIKELTNSIKMITSNINMTTSASNRVLKDARVGGKSAGEAAEKITDLVLTITEYTVAVQNLSKRSQEINEITEVITKIAEQTNLLSLNAAIEAARAGESGRGFAVVAGEVRKLAESSASSAEKINSLIRGIQNGTEQVMSSIEIGTKKAAEDKDIVGEVAIVFNEIVKTIGQITVMMSEVSHVIQMQFEGMERITKGIIEIASISQQNTSSVQEISSSIQEQMVSTQEMISQAQELSQISGQLKEIMSKFKTNESKSA